MERTLFEIQTQISQLQNNTQELPQSHSKAELSKKVRVRLSQANGELQMLLKKLTDNKGITRDELERRQRNLEKLQSKHFLLNQEFIALGGNQTTIASNIIRPMNSSLWDDLDGGPSSSRYQRGGSASGEVQGFDRDQIIRSQNEGLENLAKIISRQKNIALKIGEEVTEQDEILDDITVQLENTDGRINRGTQDIEAFTEKDSSSTLWVVILLLFVAIVIVWVI